MILFCIWVLALFISGQLKKKTPTTTPQSGLTLEIIMFFGAREMGLSLDLMGLEEI